MRRVATAIVLVVLATAPTVAHGGVAEAVAGATARVSIGTDGKQGNDMSGRFSGPAINGDGSVVAFDSIARTLVEDDTNFRADVFVRDRTRARTERVSVSTAGGQANGTSTRPTLDASGTRVAFDSSASNLVIPDSNTSLDVFLRDRAAGTTARVSVSTSGHQANDQSHSPSLSADGRFVAFVSLASNLVPDDENHVDDIFVRDLVAGTTKRVSVTTAGEEGNSSSTALAISADGRWVAFGSFANNLVPGDTNDTFDVFLHDRDNATTEMVSVGSDESLSNGLSFGPGVSADGNLVTFWSDATNLVASDTNDRRDVFLRNRAAGTTERISVNSNEQQANGTSEEPGVRGFLASSPDITPDGRFVAFFSSATNLVPGDTNRCPPVFDQEAGRCPDAFVRDLVNGTTTRVNLGVGNAEANDRTADPVISDDGTSVAFFSASTNMAVGDTNTCPLFTLAPGNCPDIFVRTVGGPEPAGADLVVTQRDRPDPVGVGEAIEYDIVVTNFGPETATDVAVVDWLHSTVRFSAAQATSGSCALAGDRVVCSVGTLPPGAHVSIEVKVRPLEGGTIANVVTASAAEDDPAPADNRAVERTTVIG